MWLINVNSVNFIIGLVMCISDDKCISVRFSYYACSYLTVNNCIILREYLSKCLEWNALVQKFLRSESKGS